MLECIVGYNSAICIQGKVIINPLLEIDLSGLNRGQRLSNAPREHFILSTQRQLDGGSSSTPNLRDYQTLTVNISRKVLFYSG